MSKMRTALIFFLLFTSFISIAQEGLKTKWKFKTQGPIRSAPVVTGDNIYFANGAGSIYCINKNNELIWYFETGGAINGSPALGNGHVYVVNRNEEVFAINSLSGKLKWKRKLGTTIIENIGGWKNFTASPVVAGDRVVVGSGDGNLYSLKARSGKISWKYNVGKRIRATSLIVGDKIYQPANDGHLHVVNKNNGRLLWKFQTDGGNPNPNDPFKEIRRGNFDQPSLEGNTLVFGSQDGKTYAVNVETHEELWRLTYGSTWAMANTVEDNTVYMGWSTNNIVCAIDLFTGKEKWKHQNGGHVYTKPLVVNNSLFYGCSNGQVYELDKKTGEEISTFQVGGEIFSDPIIDGDIIYFGSDDGFLYAVERAPNALLAVYMPDTFPGISRNVANGQMVPFLVDRGFIQLNEKTLIDFINDRNLDKAPSVIVFALPIIPQKLIGQNLFNSPFRQYLNFGGKVIWPGGVPNFFALNKDGYFKRDVETGAKLLDVEYLSPTESGNYYSTSTQLGLNMGLPIWSKSTGAYVDLVKGVKALNIDEFNKTSAWIKKFNPRSGSGFISSRTWAWNVGMNQKDLNIVYDLAVYGLK